MTLNPLIIGPNEIAALADLRERAAQHPLDMSTVVEQIKTPEGKRRHMRQMSEQTIDVPLAYVVTFSIERGHPGGTCRHMSMSSDLPGRTPIPEAVWMVAEQLGFVGNLKECAVWLEELMRGDHKANAVNVVQPINMVANEAEQ